MMNDDCTLLNAIRQTTEMGADGIDAVLPYTSGDFDRRSNSSAQSTKKFMILRTPCCTSSAENRKMSAPSPSGRVS